MVATTGILDTQGFVMPEAVELDLPAANLGLRIASGLIDLVITVVVLSVGFYIVSSTALFADVALLQALVIIATVGALVGVPITLETLLRGRTIGKLALGLRTVRDDAGPIGLRHAVIRALLMFVEVWLSLGSIAVIVAAANSKSKRLGDYLAGTYVVRDRFTLKDTPAPMADPLLEQWARGADLGSLPDALTVAVRQVLLRDSTMTPTAHASMSARLYSSVLEYVAPPPPAGAPPVAVLSTVLAERRRRDILQAARHDELRTHVLAVDPLARHSPTAYAAPSLPPAPPATPAPPHTPAG